MSFSDKDYDLLARIAREDHRRLKDLLYLSMGHGLDILFYETHVSVKRHDEEYTEEEKAQQVKNEELEKAEDWAELSFDARKERGYIHVCPYLSNHERKLDGSGYHDPLIDPLAERIKNYALEG